MVYIHIETNYTERRKNKNLSWKETRTGSQKNYFIYLFIIHSSSIYYSEIFIESQLSPTHYTGNWNLTVEKTDFPDLLEFIFSWERHVRYK